MYRFLRYIILLFIFWLVIFAIQRGVFLLYNARELSGAGAGEIALAWFYALRMDLAATAFLASLPLVLMVFGVFTRKQVWAVLANIWVILTLVLVLLTGIVDTALYSNWGAKINARALSYALFAGETAKAARAVPVWLFLLIYAGELALTAFVYLRFLRARVPEKSKPWVAVAVSVILLALMPVLFRGGFQKYPIGKNHVYYSQHRVLNYAALNGPWNLIHVLSRADTRTNPYAYFPDEAADRLFREMHACGCDSTEMLLKIPRPNIVLILMESISADNLKSLGGKEPIMPGLDSLTRSCLSFSRFYASGFRTEQGLIALLSGFPAQPEGTIMREFGKFENLPSLSTRLCEAGYHCNYYYSGDLNFANTLAYLRSSSFTKILDRDARPWVKTTDWGCRDEEIFRCHLTEGPEDARPFFTVIMTATNHEPFDAPISRKFPANDEAGRYRNTAAYTDSCVSAYIREAKKSALWENTLYLITADHAHFLPLNRQKTEAARHHAPLLITGGALRQEYTGRCYTSVVSQTDIPAFLLAQMQMPHLEFTYSKNPFNPCTPHFAFYSFDNGFGIISDSCRLAYDHDLGRVISSDPGISSGTERKWLQYGKAYLQVMYREYLEK